MSGQDFDTLDELVLEISGDPTGPYNLIENTDGTLGTYGWLTPGQGLLDTALPTSGNGIRYIGPAGASYFTSDYIPIQDGQFVAAAYSQTDGSNAYHKASFEWFDTDKVLRVTGSQTSLQAPGTTDHFVDFESVSSPGHPIAYVRLRIDLYTSGGADPTGAHHFTFTDAALAASDDENDLTDTTVVPGLDGLPYTNILQPTHSIELDRPRFDATMLTATLIGPALDPATADTIAPGRRLRLRRANGEPLCPPLVVRYGKSTDITDKQTNKTRTLIELVAFDVPMSRLAAIPALELVLDIGKLDYIIRDATLPWNVNGTTDETSPPTGGVDYVADFFEDRNYTIRGNLQLIRDTFLGYAWIDRRGVVQMWDRDEITDTVAATFSDDGTEIPYTEIDLSYSSETCINSLTIVQLVEPITDQENVEHGPFLDRPSIEAFGPAEKTVTVIGLDNSALPDYAQTVFDANATPRLRCSGLTVGVTSDQLDAITALDNNDLVRVVRTGRYDDTERITNIKHRITAGPDVQGCRWFIDYTFDTPDGVSPTASSGSPDTGGVGGTVGAPGEPGPTGPAGPTGPTGPTGPRGIARVDDPNDTLWSGALGFDVEFETDDLSGALPAGWSWVNQGTSSYYQEGGLGVLVAQPAAGTDGGQRLIVLSTASFPSTWTMTAKVGFAGRLSTGRRGISLLVRESSTGKFAEIGPNLAAMNIESNKWTTTGTFSGAITTNGEVGGVSGAGYYLRIRKNSATSWDFGYSNDGIAWNYRALGHNLSTFMTANQIGFLIGAGNNLDSIGSLHWLRVR